MTFNKIRSHAKINLALNITGKTPNIHKIESIIAFISLHDVIMIKKTKLKNHTISFKGKFSNKIGKHNTVFKLLKLLEKKKFLNNKKFIIKIDKRIPIKAGLGGGSMNAASVLKYFIKKRIIKISKKEIKEICKLIGSDVILGLNFTNSILTSKNKIKCFKSAKKFYILIVKPNFGCSTKDIYMKVRKFEKSKFSRPNAKMFNLDFIKKSNNNLEQIAFLKYPRLKSIKLYLENSCEPVLVRMTGSGSALVAYYHSREECEYAKKKFTKKYKNYWCIASKTI
tara:strand:+ start:4322 stop:5167 length:846 start_codon:yes stop_codon:yes gene_type:complete